MLYYILCMYVCIGVNHSPRKWVVYDIVLPVLPTLSLCPALKMLRPSYGHVKKPRSRSSRSNSSSQRVFW